MRQMSPLTKFHRSYILRMEVGEKAATSSMHIEVRPPLMLEFDITRNNLAQANTGKFTIYNLSERTRYNIFKDRYDRERKFPIQLFAGYTQTRNRAPIPMIFNGKMLEVISYKDNVNVRTEIDAWDGGLSNRETFLNESVIATRPIHSTIVNICKQLPDVDAVTIGQGITQPQRDLMLFGGAFTTLSKITNKKFFSDNQELFLLDDDEHIAGVPALIDAKSGLLSSPKRSGAILTIEMLFEPRLNVGQVVRVENIGEPIYNGNYIVIGFNHRGKIGFGGDAPAITTVNLLVSSRRFSLPPLKYPTKPITNRLPLRVVREGGE